ncbi:uncharacterized protein LOC112081880 [Eutrema salsugineum]|uniref:uncharacterized protein LOC112081880 n=1 Tax=Eutrema salsugineum TaxID=72664 RepID=UPI000CED0625|nr:uncharacterized protein LOC112081880 [Eutrema salsugineum]
MENSASSGNSFNDGFTQMENPSCQCKKVMTLSKSWTDENPGRRFYKCDTHGFLCWADKEKPFGWQKISLLEARDQIRRHKEQIKELNESLRTFTHQNMTGADSAVMKSKMFEKIEEEKTKLESELMASKEREKLLRQFVVISWGGFIVVTAMLLTMVKK